MSHSGGSLEHHTTMREKNRRTMRTNEVEKEGNEAGVKENEVDKVEEEENEVGEEENEAEEVEEEKNRCDWVSKRGRRVSSIPRRCFLIVGILAEGLAILGFLAETYIR